MACLSHPLIVRSALARLDGRAGEPVTIPELCDAAGVSERTLRNAFHDVYGLSPKQFLIRDGLERVHQALLDAHDARGAVTRAATDCGFFELGRFARTYRHVFGECPSETVRAAVSHL